MASSRSRVASPRLKTRGERDNEMIKTMNGHARTWLQTGRQIDGVDRQTQADRQTVRERERERERERDCHLSKV